MVFAIISLTMLLKLLADSESGSSLTHAVPSNDPNLGSIGNVPKNGTFAISANAFPPPVLKILVHSAQVGHTKLKIQN